MPRFCLIYEAYTRRKARGDFSALLLPEIAPGAAPEALRLNEAALIAAELLARPAADVCLPNGFSSHLAYGATMAWRETLIHLGTAEFTDHEEMKAHFGKTLRSFAPDLGKAAAMVLQTFVDRKFGLSMILLRAVLTYERPISSLSVGQALRACHAAVPALAEGRPVAPAPAGSEREGDQDALQGASQDASQRSPPAPAAGRKRDGAGSPDSEGVASASVPGELRHASGISGAEEENLPDSVAWERRKMSEEDEASVSLTAEVREALRKRKEYAEVAAAVTGVLDRPFAPMRSEIESMSGKAKKR